MLDEQPGPIHLLLTDVVMPGHLSGPELAEHVRHRWPHAKVIFMTGHIRESLPTGVLPPDARILVKPIRFDVLIAEVKAELGSIIGYQACSSSAASVASRASDVLLTDIPCQRHWEVTTG